MQNFFLKNWVNFNSTKEGGKLHPKLARTGNFFKSTPTRNVKVRLQSDPMQNSTGIFNIQFLLYAHVMYHFFYTVDAFTLDTTGQFTGDVFFFSLSHFCILYLVKF